MGKIGEQISGILASIIGLAILAVILSRGSTTVSVLGTVFSGLNSLIGTAISPVTGGSIASTGNYPVISAAGGNYSGSSSSGSYGGVNLSGSSGGLTIGGFGSGGGGSLSISGSTLSSIGSGISSLLGSGDSGDTGWYDV